MEEPRMLLFDLDGTLLDSTHRLPSSICDSLFEIRRRGIMITLATGRIFAAAAPFVRQLRIRIPLILYNGAVIAEPTGRIIFERRLDRQAAHDALLLAEQFDVHPQLYLDPSEGFFCVDKATDPIKKFSNKDGIPAKKVGNLASYLKETRINPVKLLIIGPREELIRLRKRYQRDHPEPICVLSEQNYLEILAPSVSKGDGMQLLCKFLDMSPQEVVAFGDNLNDREMLQLAGTGIAMASAPEEMRKEADLVVDDIGLFLEGFSESIAHRQVKMGRDSG